MISVAAPTHGATLGSSPIAFEPGAPSLQVFAKLVEEELRLPSGSATPDARLIEDLGLDSLQMLDVLLLLDALGAPLGTEELSRVSRVGDLHRRVVERLKLCQQAGLVCESGSTSLNGEDVRRPRRSTAGPRLSGVRTRQRPLHAADYEFLYDLTQAYDGAFFSRRGRGPNPDEFAKELWSGVLVQHAVLDRVTDSPIGLISARDADLHRGIVHLEFVVDARLKGRGWPFEACMLFVDHLFRSWPLRKIYAELLAHHLKDVASGIDRIFVREGVLGAHEYVDGMWVDVHILSLFRDRWNQNAPRLLRGLVLGAGGTSSPPSALDDSPLAGRVGDG